MCVLLQIIEKLDHVEGLHCVYFSCQCAHVWMTIAGTQKQFADFRSTQIVACCKKGKCLLLVFENESVLYVFVVLCIWSDIYHWMYFYLNGFYSVQAPNRAKSFGATPLTAFLWHEFHVLIVRLHARTSTPEMHRCCVEVSSASWVWHTLYTLYNYIHARWQFP